MKVEKKMGIAISSGHSKYVRGAVGIIDEVDEARRVSEAVANNLKRLGVTVAGPFHDDISTTQSSNLERIVDWHNEQDRQIDISVHFNANVETDSPMGTECLYVTQDDLATEVAAAISEAGHLKDRGPKYRSDLYFLNNTDQPAILIEVCFVDSSADVDLYQANFDAICMAIANVFMPSFEEREFIVLKGKMSTFGGPNDMGVSPDEGLALVEPSQVDEMPEELFLPEQPPGTTGLARRLNPEYPYIACRWDYDITSKEWLRGHTCSVTSADTGETFYLVRPVDWGPHEDTGRVADISPGLAESLNLSTDDECEVRVPIPAGKVLMV